MDIKDKNELLGGGVKHPFHKYENRSSDELNAFTKIM